MLRVGEELIIGDSMIARINAAQSKRCLSMTAWDLAFSFADREYDMRWDEIGTSVIYKRIS